jgi:outer membrane protein OmpA-like peptidoglycan-associated protein
MREETAVKPPLPISPAAIGLLPRKCACGKHTTDQHGQCTECQKKGQLLQRRAVNQNGPEVAPPIVHEVLRSPGQPLDPTARAFFEPRFGHDFSEVRVHTNGKAAQSARALQAQAYTVGQHVVFDDGQYAPQTYSGKRLIAHELTHVVQQNSTKQRTQTKCSISSPTNRDELEANKVAEAVMTGSNQVPVTYIRSNSYIQRACGRTEIGTPTECTPLTSEPIGELILFTLNCDTFLTPDEQLKVEDFADSMTDSDIVNVHGFASLDGSADFNEHLSCARTLRVKGILLSKGINASQINVFKHGATSGPAGERRSVMLERDPGVSRATVPQLSATIVAGPTPGNCGGMNFVISWQLSRNSAANGGFIIQDVRFVWDVRDCTGASVPNPDPRTSPLPYFEAWRLLPNSTNLSVLDGNTDTFFWPDAAPWAGGCTDGEVSITAVARYHDNVPVADMPAHMIRNNPATFAGGLRSSLSDPNLGGNISRDFPHRLRFHWVCCPCQSSPTVIDEQVP